MGGTAATHTETARCDVCVGLYKRRFAHRKVVQSALVALYKCTGGAASWKSNNWPQLVDPQATDNEEFDEEFDEDDDETKGGGDDGTGGGEKTAESADAASASTTTAPVVTSAALAAAVEAEALAKALPLHQYVSFVLSSSRVTRWIKSPTPLHNCWHYQPLPVWSLRLRWFTFEFPA